MENIVSHFAKLLKIDDRTVNLSRAKYTRVCVHATTYTQLLGGDEEQRVFMVVQHEHLPTFCYRCGLIGLREAACP